MKYTIENEALKAEISELGATLTKLIDKESGIDLVLGFDSDEDYLKYYSPNVGSMVGRNCNRIGNARFTLNGKEYNLAVNDNMNNLHGGGINGFSFRMWTTENVSDTAVTMSYFSKDGEEGFPGNLKTTVTYELVGSSVVIRIEGESDQDTIFNITNHSYFTLGDENILEDELYLTTDKYAPTDEYCLALDEVKDVKGTPYDFTQFRKMKDALNQLPKGIDNNFVWENNDDKMTGKFRNEKLQISVYTDLPDMQIYTASYLDGEKGKYGKVYEPYMAICMECQYFPNAINYEDHYLLPILKAGEKKINYIRYEISHLNKE